MRRWMICSMLVTMSARPAVAQPGAAGLAPLAIDLSKIPVGAWAEYNTTAATATVKTRWAFVAREKQSNVLETVVNQDPAGALARRVVMRFVVAADPLAPGGVLKRMLMQMGEQSPVEMPVDSMNASGQQFQKPDPKKVVGHERIKVAAGWFTATHYRDSSAEGVTDVWISEEAPPLGMVKVQTAPAPGVKDGAGRPMSAMTLELIAQGQGARAMITKPVEPFDPAAFQVGASTPRPPKPKPRSATRVRLPR